MFFNKHFTDKTHWVSFQRIYMKRKIIIKTSPEHLMFVCKCQAILNLGLGLVVSKFSKLEHIPISNPGDDFQNASLAVWSLCFSWKSELVDYLAWVHVQLYASFYFSTQKSTFLNKCQIFLRELPVDENSWKLDMRISDCRVSCSFPGSLKTFTKVLQWHIDTQRLKVLSFSTLLQFFVLQPCFDFFYTISSWIFLEFWNWITSFVC